jgi:hypothetical protein
MARWHDGAMTASEWTARLRDPELPQVEALLEAGVPGPLGAAIHAAGGEVRSLRATQIAWWPGKSCTVEWRVEVAGGPLEGSADYVATTIPAPEGAVVVGDGEHDITVWRVPDDPFLPALRTALDPGVAASLVAGLGGHITGARTRLRAYRPTRRAVIEVEGDGHRLFFKLVKPKRLDRLRRRHAELYGTLPVPEPLGVSEELGLLVMPTMQGTTLREVLEDPTAALPAPTVVTGLRHLIPELSSMGETPSAIDSLPSHAHLLSALLPEQASRIHDLVEEIGTDDVEERVPVHGDYHEAQLMCLDGQVIGLLDIDTVGWGRPADDAAVMVAHLFLWATMSAQPERVMAYATELLAHWDAELDPADLRRRVAARILGLASGAFRVQTDDWPVQTSLRVDMASAWLESARHAR